MILSKVDTKDKNSGRKELYMDTVIHGKKIRHNVRMESIRDQRYNGKCNPDINDDVHPNLCSYYDKVSTWSHRNPSGI